MRFVDAGALGIRALLTLPCAFQELAAHMNGAGLVRYASIMTLADGRSKGCG